MEQSEDSTFADIYAQELAELDFITKVKTPEPLQVTGVEALSVGESLNLFFKEFGTSVDRKMVALSKSVHTVDVAKLRKTVAARQTLYVKNVGAEILVPESFRPGLANMMAHTKGVIDGVFILSCLRTEASRLYDWLKVIVQRGRVEAPFRWTITNFDIALDKADKFVKNLPDDKRVQKATLGQAYVSFEEMYEVMESFNAAVRTLGGRDIEQANRELTQVYELGQLLVAKVQANELVFDQSVILEIEMTINRFVELTNLAGAMMTLLNELSAVFREQINAVCKL